MHGIVCQADKFEAVYTCNRGRTVNAERYGSQSLQTGFRLRLNPSLILYHLDSNQGCPLLRACAIISLVSPCETKLCFANVLLDDDGNL